MVRLLFALSLSLLATPAVSQSWRPVQFKSQYGDVIDAEALTLIVPETRSPSSQGRLTLPVIRFRSTAKKAAAPIIYLAGGPGSSGIEEARKDMFQVIMRLRQVSDVLVFDQRGTGSAAPSLSLDAKFALPLDKPLGGRETAERLAEAARQARSLVEARGVRLAAYNTRENAEDIDAVRVAAGASKIVIWGHSYGSHLGLEYVRLHPAEVEAAVLSGVNDLPNRWRLPSDGDEFIAAVGREVAKDERLSARVGDLAALVRGVLAGLEAKPLTAPVNGQNVLVGADELRTLIASRSGDIEFIQGLPLLLSELRKGHAESAAQQVAQLKSSPLGTAMRYSAHIASGAEPDRLAEIERQRAGALLGDAINFPYNIAEFREAWGIADLGSSFRKPVAGEVPILFLNGELDGRTGVREVRETALRFPRSTVTIIGSAGHDFYASTPAVTEAVAAFIANGTRPPGRIQAAAPIFWSPDELDQVAELKRLLHRDGVAAVTRRMIAMAAAAEGPYFNIQTAKLLAFQIAGQDPMAAIGILEAADQIQPGDAGLNRMLAASYKRAAKPGAAATRLEQVLKLNAFAPGAAAELRSLR